MTDLLDRRLLFVTGKGGVGKSSVSAALALLAARQGKHTLLCEVDGKGNLADFFEVRRPGFSPEEVEPNLYLMSMNTEASLREYLKLQLRVPLIARVGPLARSLDFVAQAAPGVKEILTVGKLCYEVREERWDLVVVDASATGHIIGQLAAPEAINELVKVGQVQDQTAWMVEILSDHAKTGVLIVSAPEDMPVNETIELADRIRLETSVDLAGVVVNRVLPELFGRGEEEVFERLRGADAVEVLERSLQGPMQPVLDAADLAVRLRRARAEHLTRLREELPPGTPTLYLPYLFTREHGVRATGRLSQYLGEELGF